MPCVAGCPVKVHIPAFIEKIKQGDFQGAYEVITASSSLPAVCGRVCPQETQCESRCVRGIKGESVGIGRLERFVADWHNTFCAELPERPESNGHRVAVVGSGPSGLTCAGDLAKKGYQVTVFEALHTAGGVLVYGIPEFRLPKAIVAKEIDTLQKLGVKIETNVVIGKTLTVDELFEMGYQAVFIGSGAGLPNFMGIPGESLNGVYSANEFLTRSNLMKSYLQAPQTPVMKGGKVAVVGGGNVAMDAARTALRLGAEKVYIVYRRSMEELPARREEVEHAMEEGIEFCLLCNPVEILGYHNPDDQRDPKNGFVRGMTCVRMELGEPDERGRRRPVAVENSEFTIDVDTVIMSIGTSPNPLIKSTTKGLEVNRWGGIVVNEDGLTSKDAVYAGGDAVTGAATVISAMGAGKTAAKAIDLALSK
jgi:glutamate synthase (NADPH/NADH) small chain